MRGACCGAAAFAAGGADARPAGACADADCKQVATNGTTPINNTSRKPPLRTMFEDVYAHVPWHLDEQYRALDAHLGRQGRK